MNAPLGMSTIRFNPLTTETLDQTVRICADEAVLQLLNEVPSFYHRLLAPGAIAQVMLDRGMIIGAGGITPHWHGRAEAWLMLAPHATRRHRVAALRRAKTVMAWVQLNPAYRRIEMYVRADQQWARSFGQLMGFRLEGTARAWCPRGRDYHLFARIEDQHG